MEQIALALAATAMVLAAVLSAHGADGPHQEIETGRIAAPMNVGSGISGKAASSHGVFSL